MRMNWSKNYIDSLKIKQGYPIIHGEFVVDFLNCILGTVFTKKMHRDTNNRAGYDPKMMLAKYDFC